MRLTRDRIRFIGLIIWPLALLALAACVLLGSYFVQRRDRPMIGFNQPPIYPAAQQVNVVMSNTLVKQITFVTADSPSTVLDYYRQMLTGQGWQERDIYVPLTPGLDGPQITNASYFACEYMGRFYHFNVLLNPAGPNKWKAELKTWVELQM